MPIYVPSPSRYVFWSRDVIVEPLKVAIDARRRAAAARSDMERTHWRREMRYQAREAVRLCRREMRQRAEAA